MRVLVTGGAGKVGLAVVERLVAHGWEVAVVGRRGAAEVPQGALHGASYAACDITQYEDVLAQMRGCDSVVHLAAIPYPGGAPAAELFAINVAGTFNVFEAAARLGVRRVVQASSINALGCFYSVGELEPDYLPVDELHPVRTTDPYSLSKHLVEQIGDYYWRRDGIASVSLRLPAVWRRERASDPEHRARVREQRAVLDAFLALSEGSRRARLADLSAQAVVLRRMRPFEQADSWRSSPLREAFTDDPLGRIYAFDRFVLWTAIDERDAAQAVERALTAPLEGSHTLFVNDSRNWLGYDALVMAQLFFPQATVYASALHGPAALVSAERARRLLGFAPEYPIYEEA